MEELLLDLIYSAVAAPFDADGGLQLVSACPANGIRFHAHRRMRAFRMTAAACADRIDLSQLDVE